MNLLLVLIGGFLGGAVRSGFTHLLPSPYCTFVSNILGSLIFGLAVGFSQLANAPFAYSLFALGVAGGLSTWSTMANELGEMLKQRHWWPLCKYLFWTVGIGVVLAWRGAMWADIIYRGI
ncbi:CrcB family protein [Corynebacterium macginleyi]|uniref:Fluoride-specific ion channel FluC n=1 Tax=Corynebacterium macginleyi TaxID=38290 RepID=A0ABS1Y7Z8_9CORY|nr:CrcB family protein [Corynebacterium macginleyi]MBK4140358.1 CrcB family protein [Corynebacterium macginleyi]MBK4143167.1 CrcB family protein [Corynebacterium macginleyi]MBK4150550.1 CrcB family protein [Corynebacterium macginleyi]MBK4153261.1 CrcB family protein [Corynebacterium macginleyi]MBK4161004.1 CrcB family protein [Corynebacterium macginleyi]